MSTRIIISTMLSIILFSSPSFSDTTWVNGTIINETWESIGSPYCVDGDIFIANLSIEPDVEIVFFNNYEFRVGGILTASGNEQDSILFTKLETINGWQGIIFDRSNPGSVLDYCRVSGSINSGIRIIESQPQIRNCLIYGNTGARGGGIDVINNTILIIENCIINSNSITGFDKKGGGLSVSGGETQLIDCIVSGNSVSVSGHNSVSKGGGVYIDGNLNMQGSLILYNYTYSYASENYWNVYSYGRGGGIYITGDLYMAYSKIKNNHSESETYAPGPGGGHSDIKGGGIYAVGSSIELINSIIAYDSLYGDADGSVSKKGGGIYINSEYVNITNCTVAYNSNYGLYNMGDTVEIINSIFWDNGNNQISGVANATYSNIRNGYPGIGNIDANPLFYNTPDSLWIVFGSLCIDAGNPQSYYNDCRNPENPDSALPPAWGTIRNDMGAHGGCDIVTSITEYNWITPTELRLSQNYPNPFNPRTTIEYDLPYSS